MRIGILETGRVSAELVGRHGDYPAMMRRLMDSAGPPLSYTALPVVDGKLPEDPRAADVWLITGSRHGVYDPLPWMSPLKGFLQAARSARVPIVGICFGHQILAEAFGGRAEKSDRGWACGVHAYAAQTKPTWMADADPQIQMHAMHQDQVTAAPPDATLLASSAFCPFAMLAYGDPEAPDAISLQPHPEFEPAYAADLIDRRRGVAIPEPIADAGKATIGRPVDNDAFAKWVLAYLGTRGTKA